MQRGTVAGACQFRFLLSEKLEPTFHDKMSTCGLGTIPWLNSSLCKSSRSMGLERWGLKLCIAGKSKERFTSELPVLAWSFKTWTERRLIMSVDIFFFLYSRVAENIKEINNISTVKNYPMFGCFVLKANSGSRKGAYLRRLSMTCSTIFNAFSFLTKLLIKSRVGDWSVPLQHVCEQQDSRWWDDTEDEATLRRLRECRTCAWERVDSSTLIPIRKSFIILKAKNIWTGGRGLPECLWRAWRCWYWCRPWWLPNTTSRWCSTKPRSCRRGCRCVPCSPWSTSKTLAHATVPAIHTYIYMYIIVSLW